MGSPRIVTAREIEGTLRRLRGVVAARVVSDASGGIQEIHALAEPGRPAKMVVRDIESTLLANWNLTPGREKISVAQLQPGSAESARLPRPRLRFIEAQVDEEGGAWRAQVTLRHGDSGSDVVGEASTFDAQRRLAIVAEATLCSVEKECGAGRLRLLDINLVSLEDRQAVVLLVAMRGDKGDDLLTGSALVRAETDRAVVSATLDAVNRRLAALEGR